MEANASLLKWQVYPLKANKKKKFKIYLNSPPLPHFIQTRPTAVKHIHQVHVYNNVDQARNGRSNNFTVFRSQDRKCASDELLSYFEESKHDTSIRNWL